jgi:hypothetical protein
LGGERFPRDVRAAITEETFCVVALLSRASLRMGSEAERERELALRMVRERGTGFLIVLDLDGTARSVLDPADGLTLIPARDRWDTAFEQLRARLEALEAPRPLSDGERVAEEARRAMAERRSWPTWL